MTEEVKMGKGVHGDLGNAYILLEVRRGKR
jgi:hypothetical protein